MAEVSVIVVSWNTRDELLDCAASVLAEERARERAVDLELVVVDNGSSDGSVAALRAAHPRARVIEAGGNLGFAEGVNRGLAATTSPWVFLLNSDAVVEPGALACLLADGRAAGPEVAALQPTMVFKHDPAMVSSTGILLFSDGTARDRGFGEPCGRARDGGGADIFGASAGAALCRRSVLERVALPSGVLDRGFFMYFEDVDLAWRLRLAGYSARHVARARVLHRVQASSRQRGRHFVIRRCRENRLRMLLKNASPAMLSRSLRRTAGDLARVASTAGARGWGDLRCIPAACRAAFAERALVTRLASVSRADLERRWVGPDPLSLRARLAGLARARIAHARGA